VESIQFQTTIGEDGIIRLPPGVSVPPGEADVTVIPHRDTPSGSDSAGALINRLATAAANLRIPLDDLPTDLAQQHDHYLHGLPKGIDEP